MYITALCFPIENSCGLDTATSCACHFLHYADNEFLLQAGVSADSLSHEDYLNAPGESVSSKFTTPGEYSYYCEPHQGAGMAGKIIVQ